MPQRYLDMKYGKKEKENFYNISFKVSISIEYG